MSIVILGAAGQAKEVYWHYHKQLGGSPPKAYFVDDITDTKTLCLAPGLIFPVIKDWNFTSTSAKSFLVGVAAPAAKRLLVKKALAQGLRPMDPITAGATILGNVKIGKGTLIASGCVLTTDITIGEYVILNLSCTVGHDTTIEDYCTVNPGCNISGNVSLASDVQLGAGTVIRQKIRIAAQVTTGAQACVVSNIEKTGAVFVGTPAKELKRK